MQALNLSDGEALALLRELAGLPPAPAAEAALPSSAPVLLNDGLVELLDLRHADDGTWWATVKSAHRPATTPRHVRIAGLSLVTVDEDRRAA